MLKAQFINTDTDTKTDFYMLFLFLCNQKMFQDEDVNGNKLLTPLAGIFVSKSNEDIKIELSKLEPGWKIRGSNVKVRIGNLVVNSLTSLMI